MNIDKKRDVTFTTRMGVFTFDSGVNLGHAKRLRDEVMGQFFNPKPGTFRIRNEKDAEMYIRDHKNSCISGIPFDLVMVGSRKSRGLEERKAA